MSQGRRRRDVQRREGSESRRDAQHREGPESSRDARHRGGSGFCLDVQRGRTGSRRLFQHRAMVRPVLREFVIVVGFAVVVSLLVKTWLMQEFFIPTGSMENTLVKDDRVVVSKLVPSPISLRRGDVIVFADPDHWLPSAAQNQHSRLSTALTFVGLLPNDEGNHLIKRVIGLPGDRVVCCNQDKKLTVNGVALNEPYVFPGDVPSQESFDITVPAGRVWVMGDHRSDSADSRPHDENSGGAKGSVPETLIVGRAIALVWPLNHLTWLSNPSQTFAGIRSASAK
jgi:signal peptidase I